MKQIIGSLCRRTLFVQRWSSGWRALMFSGGLALALLALSGVHAPRAAASSTPAPGTIITVAGTGQDGFSGDGGPATGATLSGPYGLAIDSMDNLFICDLGNKDVRKVSPDGIIQTVAGSGEEEYSGDGGAAADAGLRPIGATFDSSGNLYIADADHLRVRKVTPDGLISMMAGSGPTGANNGSFSGDGGPATSARLGFTWSVAVDAKGNLYISDLGNNRVRKVDTAGIITTVAGTGGPNFASSGDGGPATEAELDPYGMILDQAGRLYIADADSHRVRVVDIDGKISTIAGGGNPADGVGDGLPATQARLEAPVELALDGAGNLFIADGLAQRIRRVGPGGIISTVVGTGQTGFSPDGTLATQARLYGPFGLAFDKAGNLYYTETGRVNVTNDSGTHFTGDGDSGRVREVVGVGVPR